MNQMLKKTSSVCTAVVCAASLMFSSSALVMAAEVLIGIMIISLGVYLFATYSQTSKEIFDKRTEQQIVQFNTRYTQYVGKELTIYDVRTIATYANSDNQDIESDSEKINVYLQGNNVTNKTSSEWDSIIQNAVNGITNANKDLIKYKCEEPEYSSSTGKIKKMNINKE